MSFRSFRAPLITSALVLGTAGLAACSTPKVDATVAVTGTDAACTPASTSVAAGRVEFAFTNKAGKTNELYVKRGDKILGEKEDVAPGATRSVAVTLKAGDYTLVCKPGQTGDGVSSPFTVTG
jgi:iron uptake system component EfeO